MPPAAPAAVVIACCRNPPDSGGAGADCCDGLGVVTRATDRRPRIWHDPPLRGRGLLRARLPSAGRVRRDHPGSFPRIAGPVGPAAVNEGLLQGPGCEQWLAATHVPEPKPIGPACMASPGMSGPTD